MGKSGRKGMEKCRLRIEIYLKLPLPVALLSTTAHNLFPKGRRELHRRGRRTGPSRSGRGLRRGHIVEKKCSRK